MSTPLRVTVWNEHRHERAFEQVLANAVAWAGGEDDPATSPPAPLRAETGWFE